MLIAPTYICNMAKGANTSYPKEKIKILFLENISDVAVGNFRRHGYVQVEKISRALRGLSLGRVLTLKV